MFNLSRLHHVSHLTNIILCLNFRHFIDFKTLIFHKIVTTCEPSCLYNKLVAAVSKEPKISYTPGTDICALRDNFV